MTFGLRSFVAFLASAIIWLPASPLRAEATQYRLSPGDTVEITIASMPERTSRALVQSDGTISLPLVGSVSVEGLTPAELQSRMEMVLASKPYRLRMPDGREQTALIQPGDVSAVISDFRPVYVSGDVLTPGAQPYRLLMTVRQAIAVAGGYSLLRAKSGQDAGDPVDLQRDYDSLWADFVKEHYRNVRLKAQLNGQAEFDMAVPSGSPLPAAAVTAIAENEAQSLRLTMDNSEKERAFLQQAVKDAETQTDLLSKREQSEADGVAGDEADLANVQRLFKAGNVTSTRLADVRRALLLSSSRRLETSVQLMRVKRQTAEFARQLEKNRNDEKIGLFSALNDTQARLADLTIRLRAAAMKLHLSAATGGDDKANVATVQTSVTIARRVGAEWQQVPARIDAELLPGDVVEVVLGSTSQSAATTR